MFSSLSSFSLSHLFSPLFRPKHHPPPNINITMVHFFLWVAIRVMFSVLGFFFFFFWVTLWFSLMMGWSGLIKDGGNVDLAAAVCGLWSGLIWVPPPLLVMLWFSLMMGWFRLINDGGNVDLAATMAVFGFWSGLIWIFYFFIYLIWVFAPMGFWWAVVAC